MALFGTKKKTGAKKSAKPKASGAPKKASEGTLADSRLEGVIKAPWMSEKALIGTEKGIYVFEVAPRATKQDVANAVERLYKVRPRQVRITNLPGKRKALRSKRGFGRRAARTKAYVYLKSGETIQFA